MTQQSGTEKFMRSLKKGDQVLVLRAGEHGSFYAPPLRGVVETAGRKWVHVLHDPYPAPTKFCVVSGYALRDDEVVYELHTEASLKRKKHIFSVLSEVRRYDWRDITGDLLRELLEATPTEEAR